ncbi:hypothetical protein BC936DRAFT_137061 [Jimgerdemannia flammicorona]|uniref:Uncharacterized protein n=1 Tax=Jimgerdemannia flammicorona TaxID=994334 RepID=A0A433DJF2_9FUNG|nr:hypothetical protein BC936DRAFT_137061 [Jimgerdemannia flammicorona]
MNHSEDYSGFNSVRTMFPVPLPTFSERKLTPLNPSLLHQPSTSGSTSGTKPPGLPNVPRNPHIPPSDPDFECRDFVAAEGQYVLKQDIFNETLLPAYTVGTTASLVSIKYKEYPSHVNASNKSTSSSGDNVSAIDRVGETLVHGDSDDDAFTPATTITGTSTPGASAPSSTTTSSSQLVPPLPPRPPTITTPSTPPPVSDYALASPKSVGPPVLAIEGKGEAGESGFTMALFTRNKQPKKPKNNLTKTNSSFVQKIVTNENLAKILSQRTSEDTYLFYNVGRCFVWMDATSKPKEPLSRIVFAKAYPTSHDVNLLTRGCDHLDVIIGFSSGDCIWFDPLCNKYYRLNKAVGSTVGWGGFEEEQGRRGTKRLEGYEKAWLVSQGRGIGLVMTAESVTCFWGRGEFFDKLEKATVVCFLHD